MELIKWLGLALVFLLGPVILIHELGHFLVAKWAGVRVLEFGLGFPPRLLTLAQERGTIEVEGMEMSLPPRLQLPEELAAGQQVEILARRGKDGGFEAAHVARLEPYEADGEGEAGSAGSRPAPIPQETADGIWARGRLTSFKPGTRYSLNLLPIGAFVRMLGEEDPSDPESLAAKPKRWRLAVILAGAALNLVAAFVLLSAAYVAGIPERTLVEINDVLPGTPAQAAGLNTGDVVVAVNGERLEKGPGELQQRIQALPGQEISLEVLRNGQQERRETVTVTPRMEDGHGFLGISMQAWPDSSSLVHYSPTRAVGAASQDLTNVFVRIFRLPRMVAAGEVEPAEMRPTGPAGILQWLGLALKKALEWRVPFPALQTTAMISLAIGISNLLPLPALDGGRALFILIEAIRGRRISPSTEALIHMVGMVILLILSAIIIVQDIFSPLVPWSLLKR